MTPTVRTGRIAPPVNRALLGGHRQRLKARRRQGEAARWRGLAPPPPLESPAPLAWALAAHARDAAQLVADARRQAAEEAQVEGGEVGGHAVDGGYGAQRADVVVGAPVPHDTDGAHRQEHGEG